VPKPVHKRTGFLLEEGHKYYHEDDAQDNTPFENSKYAFRSPTGLIKDFHEEFDTIPEAKKYVIRHKPPLRGSSLFCLGHAWGYGFFEGTTLHGYGESLFNKWGMQAPDLAKTRFVEDLHKELTSKYVLAKTELLVYL
jgi:hypothetical protein